VLNAGNTGYQQLMNNGTILRNATLAFLITFAIGATALAQSTVAVVVNGSPMQFVQPPIERAGRVFVPLRGIFEQLGATVVYSNGTINATGNGRTVSLQIGSNQATVNGQPQTLDEAPFIQGASTLVPLRFIATSLGASVDWNNNTSTVTINGSNGGYRGNGGNHGHDHAMQGPAFYLSDQTPMNTVNTRHPAIHATYSSPVSRRSVRILIDGRDVTSQVYSNATGFDFTPTFPVTPGRHRVAVTGTTQTGVPFSAEWSFVSYAAPGGR
jgi:Copper amine oxidase N-terminal domain